MLQITLALLGVFTLTTAKNVTWITWGTGFLPESSTACYGVGTGLGSLLLSLLLTQTNVRKRLDLKLKTWLYLELFVSPILMLSCSWLGPNVLLLTFTFAVNSILSSLLMGKVMQHAISSSSRNFFRVRCAGTIAFIGTMILVILDAGLGVVLAVAALTALITLEWCTGPGETTKTPHREAHPPGLLTSIERSLSWISIIAITTACTSRSFEAFGIPALLKSPVAVYGLLFLGCFECVFLFCSDWLTQRLNLVFCNLTSWMIAYAALILVPSEQGYLIALPFLGLNCLTMSQLQMAGEYLARKNHFHSYQVFISNLNAIAGLLVVIIATYLKPIQPWYIGLVVAVISVLAALMFEIIFKVRRQVLPSPQGRSNEEY